MSIRSYIRNAMIFNTVIELIFVMFMIILTWFFPSAGPYFDFSTLSFKLMASIFWVAVGAFFIFVVNPVWTILMLKLAKKWKVK